MATPVKLLTPVERRSFAEMVSMAETLPRNYVLCRLVGHAWDPMKPDIKPAFGGPLMCWFCIRCTTKRYDSFDSRWGQLIARRYEYADGYLLRRADGQRGNEPLHRAAVRAAYDHMTTTNNRKAAK